MLVKDSGSYGHKGMWLLVSKTSPHRVLQVFGPIKPSDADVLKSERRVQFFKNKQFTNVRKHVRRVR